MVPVKDDMGCAGGGFRFLREFGGRGNQRAEQAGLADDIAALVAALGGILAIVGRIGARRTLR